MDQRPPSSRPKTSTGRPGTSSKRPKTAGRGVERPPTRQIPVRPFSRIGAGTVDPENSAIFERAISRGSTVNPPTSTIGMRTPNRSNQRPPSAAMRPGTGQQYFALPPGTGHHRPVTQQGMSGVRTQSRMGSSMGNRQVLDKTYYISLLNNQLRLLQIEIDSLVDELEKTEKGQQNLLFYEQKAEKQANELKELQGELSDFNLIIDRHNTNADLKDLEFELFEVQKSNDELAQAMEELFQERREKEDFIYQFENRIQRVRRQNVEQINNLEPSVKDEFERVKEETESLRQELEGKQQELEQLNKTKEELELALGNSPLKQQASILEEQIYELEEKKNAIMKELNFEGTPEEQRQNLINRIQKDNEEIAHMQIQLQNMNERMSQAQEELREFENEFEILAGDKSERFRELKNRDAQMDAFLESFGSLSAEVEAKIETLSTEVVRLLNLISINCRHNELSANISGLDESFFNSKFSKSCASATELQDLHVRLQDQLISLQMNEARLHQELEGMRKKQMEIEEAGPIVDIDLLKKQIEDKQMEYQEKCSRLSKEISRAELENDNLKQQIEATEQKLAQNSFYSKLKELKKRVDVAEDEKRVLKEKVDSLIAKNDYQPLKQKALQLRTEYNNVLVQSFSSSDI